MIYRMPRLRMRALVRPQERDYGEGLRKTMIMVDPDDWEAYARMCAELGVSRSAGLRQMVRRAVKGYERNG